MAEHYHIPFSKYEGLGNDFIIVDVRNDAERGSRVRAASARLCDRHFGIGADGVLIVEPGENNAVAMRVVNADGSCPQMCGNGLRCVVQWLRDRGEVSAENLFHIDTDAGPHRVVIDGDLIEVQMARPRFHDVTRDGPLIEQPITALDTTFTASAVSMGNPHLIVFDTPPEPETVARFGAALCQHPLFEHQANVSFCALESTERGAGLRVTVHERGAGVTLACGTGACAAAAAHVLAGRLPPDRFVPVVLPGGTLMINVPGAGLGERTAQGDGGHILMRGPARHVYDGQIAL